MNRSYDMGYKRVSGVTRCNGFRGIRLNIKRLSIHKLRVKFMRFFKMIFKWRKSYNHAVKSLRKGIIFTSSCKKSNNNNYNNQSQSCLIGASSRYNNKQHIIQPECMLRSLGRTNSFYTEAIADCLEFIKRNSISLDDPHDIDNEAASISTALR